MITYSETQNADVITYLVLSLSMSLISILTIFYLFSVGMPGGKLSFFESVTILFIASITTILGYKSLKQVIERETIFGKMIHIFFSGLALFVGLYLLLFSLA